MKQIFIILTTVLLAFCCQDVSAQDCNLFLRYKGLSSLQDIPTASIEAKAEQLKTINERAKEIRKANRNKLFAGIAVGVAAVGTAVAAGVAAGKAQKKKNEEARAAELENSQALQAQMRADYQQQMAARGVDITKSQTQQIAEREGKYKTATIDQTVPTNKRVISSNGSDPYGERGASVASSYPMQQSAQSGSGSEQIVTGCAVVNGQNVPVQLKVIYTSSSATVKGIKLNTSKISGVVDNNWVSVFQVIGTSKTNYMDGSYSKDYRYSFDYDVTGLNQRVTIYFN